jgi:hypothetical protein
MSSAENETEVAELPKDGDVDEGDAESLFGSYSVLSPGVQIVLDGRAVSAPHID